MSEKMRDKVERLSSDLAKSVQAEIEMFDYAKTVKAEKEKLERQFLEYAKDHGVANNLEEALAFLAHYSKSKQEASEAQLKLDI